MKSCENRKFFHGCRLRTKGHVGYQHDQPRPSLNPRHAIVFQLSYTSRMYLDLLVTDYLPISRSETVTSPMPQFRKQTIAAIDVSSSFMVQ